ncbi:MAG: hypothetical protein HOP19_04755 [Acidobacteria bacterium]|nr:hypothetical protein [Acidobacteriota bacterium]
MPPSESAAFSFPAISLGGLVALTIRFSLCSPPGITGQAERITANASRACPSLFGMNEETIIRRQSIYDGARLLGVVEAHSTGKQNEIALIGSPAEGAHLSPVWETAVRSELALCFEAGIETVHVLLRVGIVDMTAARVTGWREGAPFVFTMPNGAQVTAQWWTCCRAIWLLAINAHLN